MNCPTGRHRGPHTDGTGGRGGPCKKGGWDCTAHNCLTDECLDVCPGCDGTQEVNVIKWLYWKVRTT